MSHVQRILNLYKEGKVNKSTIIKMASFKEEFKSFLNEDDDNVEKTAALPGAKAAKKLYNNRTARGVLIGALVAPTLAASGFLVGKGVDNLEEAKKKMNRTKNFEQMLESRPELKAEDQLLIKKYWDSLAYFAPAIARDPLAAGAYIKQMLQYEDVGGPPYSTIKDLVQTQKSFRDSHPFHSEGIGEAIASGSSRLSLSKKID